VIANLPYSKFSVHGGLGVPRGSYAIRQYKKAARRLRNGNTRDIWESQKNVRPWPQPPNQMDPTSYTRQTLSGQEKDSKADHKSASSLCEKASKSSSAKIELPDKGVSEPKRTDTEIYKL
jgi:hypothetical protein